MFKILAKIMIIFLLMGVNSPSSFAQNEVPEEAKTNREEDLVSLGKIIKWASESEEIFLETKERAEKGNVDDQFSMGFSYYKGNKFVAQDYFEALRWYRLAAEQGDVMAQYNIGEMYWEGKGVLKDSREALKWFSLSAENGWALAQNYLGFIYFYGTGVTQNFPEAFHWYRLAAENLGPASAQYRLGTFYKEGLGTPQDFVTAHMWFNIAAANGNDAARNVREEIAKQMTPDQIAEAQRLAKEWFETH